MLFYKFRGWGIASGVWTCLFHTWAGLSDMGRVVIVVLLALMG